MAYHEWVHQLDRLKYSAETHVAGNLQLTYANTTFTRDLREGRSQSRYLEVTLMPSPLMYLCVSELREDLNPVFMYLVVFTRKTLHRPKTNINETNKQVYALELIHFSIKRRNQHHDSPVLINPKHRDIHILHFRIIIFYLKVSGKNSRSAHISCLKT